MGDVTLAVLLELLEQAAQTAVEHRAGRGTAENSAEGTTQQIAEPAVTAAARHAGGDVAARTRGRLCLRGVRPTHVFHGVDREQAQQRLGHGRHALAGCLAGRRWTRTRIAGSSAGGADGVENIAL